MVQPKTPPPADASQPPERLDVTRLLRREREILVQFSDQTYRLKLTRNQKLILTK